MLTYDNVLEVLGAVDSSVFSQLLREILAGDTAGCIHCLEEMVIQGRELGQFVVDFIWYLRNLLIVQSADDAENILDTSMENLRQLKEEAALTDGNTLMRYIRIFSELSGQMRYASQKRVLLEIAFIKLTKPSMEQNLDSVLQRISELEARIAQIPSPAELAALAAAGQASAAQGTAGGVSISEAAGEHTAEPETVVLPKAQYEELMAVKGDWGKLSRKLGGAMRVALQGTSLKPAGEGCLSIEFTDVNNYSIMNQENRLAELKELVEADYHRTIEFKAHLRETSVPVSTVYVSDEDLKVIHDVIEIED